MSANLLNGLKSNFCDFSERALINNANQLDFDSAIPNLAHIAVLPAKSILDEVVIC